MKFVLDTAHVRPGDRVDAVNDALSGTEAPMRFADNSGGLVHLRMQHWQLGAGAHVVEAIGTASRLIRGREHLQIPAPERAGVAMQLGSAGYLDAGGIHTVTSPGHLHVADETQTFDLQWRGNGGSKAFVVDYDRLGSRWTSFAKQPRASAPARYITCSGHTLQACSPARQPCRQDRP